MVIESRRYTNVSVGLGETMTKFARAAGKEGRKADQKATSLIRDYKSIRLPSELMHE